jgi:hypothetical protein
VSSTIQSRQTAITGKIGAAGLAVAVVFALAGCSFSANPTLPAEEVAGIAAKALSEQWDTDATVDCGDESIKAVVDTAVECTAYNPKSDLDYPATVTLTKIEGSNVSVSVVTGPAIAPDGGEDDGGPEAPANAPTVAAQGVAALAAGALAEKIGYTPEIDCGADPISIYIDAEIECVATADDGKDYPAHIIVTDVSATNYNIDVTLGADPVS